MKHLAMTALLIVTLAAIVGLSEMRTTRSQEYQRRAQPLFFDFSAEYDFVPAPNNPVAFQKPVKVRNIDYPWVLVEPANATPTRQNVKGTWVNMDFIAVVRRR